MLSPKRKENVKKNNKKKKENKRKSMNKKEKNKGKKGREIIEKIIRKRLDYVVRNIMKIIRIKFYATE